ncbi:amino acid ABC transporter permease [Streptomyces violaceorubidus]
MSSVLYDAQGPRAKRRNVLFTVVFLVAFAALLWWVFSTLNDKAAGVGPVEAVLHQHRGVVDVHLAGSAEHPEGRGPRGGHRPAARRGTGHRPPFLDHAWVRVPAAVVVKFSRSIPVLVLMIFGLALFAEYTNVSSDDRPLYAVVTGLVLYNASVLAEIVRSGILALPKGQGEGAMAIGLRKGQVMRLILLPQAVTAMPAIVSQLVVILEDTALGGAILTFPELLASANTMSGFYGANVIASYTVVAVIYIALNFALTTFASWLERRLRRAKKSTGAVLSADDVGGRPTPERSARSDTADTRSSRMTDDRPTTEAVA